MSDTNNQPAIPVPPVDPLNPYEVSRAGDWLPSYPSIDYSDYANGNDVATPIHRLHEQPEEFVCRYQIGVSDGVLYMFPGTINVSDGEENRWFRPMWPTLAGQPLGPLNENNTVAEIPVIPGDSYAVLMFCDDLPEVKILDQEAYGKLDEDYPLHWKFLIAEFTIETVQVTVGFDSNGNPIQENRDEATSMNQLICSDIDLAKVPNCDDDDSSGSDDPGSGSSKDSAIVPVHWSPTGYTALYCVESPDVRFEDTYVVERPKGKRTWEYRVSGKFKSVLADNSMEVVSCTADKPHSIGVTINADGVCTFNTSLLPWCRPNRIVIRVTGIRRGFNRVRFEYKTKQDFELNEKRLNLATYNEAHNVV